MTVRYGVTAWYHTYSRGRITCRVPDSGSVPSTHVLCPQASLVIHHQRAAGAAGLAGGQDSAAGCPVFPTAVETVGLTAIK